MLSFSFKSAIVIKYSSVSSHFCITSESGSVECIIIFYYAAFFFYVSCNFY